MQHFVRPAGPADAEEIAAVQQASWRATYKNLLLPESIARVEKIWDAEHWRQSLERTDNRVVPLVLDGEDTGIVGFGVGGPRRGMGDPRTRSFTGEVYLLYLLPAFQKRGYGGRLIASLARVLIARGMESAVVWALATNRKAIGFYQHLGGTILVQRRKPFFGEQVNEVALGWRDLDVLASAPRNMPQ